MLSKSIDKMSDGLLQSKANFEAVKSFLQKSRYL